MWVFETERAWESFHKGADIRLPRVFKLIMTYITPIYLFTILLWWGITDAWPILTMAKTPGGAVPDPAIVPYVHASRAILAPYATVSAAPKGDTDPSRNSTMRSSMNATSSRMVSVSNTSLTPASA